MRTLGTGIVLYRDKLGMPVQIGTANLGSYLVVDMAMLLKDAFMLPVQWMVKEEELRVIHYTLGPLKPWDWWTAWLLKPVDVWQVIDLIALAYVT
ncbi:hypothetical protein GW17_00040323 [Ensete ventricosum]|nr:hypothetical protein GW17_00040323 [Ensete ventricosum]RZS06812.1 hypothetical protein BHM03_00037530 [Ensete ventricosum]